MTPQDAMAAKLAEAGIPSKEIRCYGAQIVITAWSRDAADKWADLLAKFATVRGVVRSRDDAKVNRNTMLKPSTVEVWRVFAKV
jgi:hypothetical protein